MYTRANRDNWTPERINRVRQCAAKFMTVRQIADELAHGDFQPSRNAVIGIMRREGIKILSDGPKEKTARNVGRMEGRFVPLPHKASPRPRFVAQPVPPAAAVPLWETGLTRCKYIVADKAMCCGDALSKFRRMLPFCDTHLQKCTTPEWWARNAR
jgi:hypothetical protein